MDFCGLTLEKESELFMVEFTFCCHDLDCQEERKEQLIFLKQRPAYVDVKDICESVLKGL